MVRFSGRVTSPAPAAASSRVPVRPRYPSYRRADDRAKAALRSPAFEYRLFGRQKDGCRTGRGSPGHATQPRPGLPARALARLAAAALLPVKLEVQRSRGGLAEGRLRQI